MVCLRALQKPWADTIVRLARLQKDQAGSDKAGCLFSVRNSGAFARYLSEEVQEWKAQTSKVYRRTRVRGPQSEYEQAPLTTVDLIDMGIEEDTNACTR